MNIQQLVFVAICKINSFFNEHEHTSTVPVHLMYTTVQYSISQYYLYPARSMNTVDCRLLLYQCLHRYTYYCIHSLLVYSHNALLLYYMIIQIYCTVLYTVYLLHTVLYHCIQQQVVLQYYISLQCVQYTVLSVLLPVVYHVISKQQSATVRYYVSKKYCTTDPSM